jgi:hypothetical protein
MVDKVDELKDRVEARKHELLAKYHELKADTAHESIEARTHLKKKLDDLERYIKGGWDHIDASVRAKLDKWLDHD